MPLGPVMLDIAGVMPTAEEKEKLAHPLSGGVILFSRNFESPEQLKALTAEIHAVRDPQLIIAVDHEGGRVQRFREGFTHLPPAAAIGHLYENDKQQGLQTAEQLGWLLAAELLSYGVDISFAPVLDIAYGVSGVIGDRAFHRRAQIVAELAHASISGMQRAGMAATGKHFPGHGGVKEDSHIAKPVDPRRLEELMQEDIVPFRHLIANGLAGIMPAHVVYSQVDTKPAGYSEKWLKDVLRQQLGFQGVIFSDDLSMDAADIGHSYAERADLALRAGCDMVLVCNHPEAAIEVLDALPQYKQPDSPIDPASQSRLMRMQGKTQEDYAGLCQTAMWQQASRLANQLSDKLSSEIKNV